MTIINPMEDKDFGNLFRELKAFAEKSPEGGCLERTAMLAEEMKRIPVPSKKITCLFLEHQNPLGALHPKALKQESWMFHYAILFENLVCDPSYGSLETLDKYLSSAFIEPLEKMNIEIIKTHKYKIIKKHYIAKKKNRPLWR